MLAHACAHRFDATLVYLQSDVILFLTLFSEFFFRFAQILFILLTSDVMETHAVIAVKQITAYESTTERKLDID